MAARKAVLTVVAFAFLAALTIVVAGCGGKGEPTFTISGTVKDASGDPLQGAKVSDSNYGPEPYKSATTGADGKYSFKTWAEEHDVTAEATGYTTVRKNLKTALQGGKTEATIDFELEPSPTAEE
jgi:hypothetical protein